MIDLKKPLRRGDNWLGLTLLLSLIRSDSNPSNLYLNHDIGDLAMGQSWAHMQTSSHHNSLANWVGAGLYPSYKYAEEALADYQEQLAEDLYALGRYNNFQGFYAPSRRTIANYLLNQEANLLPEPAVPNHTNNATGPSLRNRPPQLPPDVVDGNGDRNQEQNEPVKEEAPDTSNEHRRNEFEEDWHSWLQEIFNEDEQQDVHIADSGTSDQTSQSPISESIAMSEEDAELIEILWKQDVDLGVSCANVLASGGESTTNGEETLLEKKKAIDAKTETPSKGEDDPPADDPWAGLQYVIDSETGEHILAEVSAPNTESRLLCEESSATTCEPLHLLGEIGSPTDLDLEHFLDLDNLTLPEERGLSPDLDQENPLISGSVDPVLGSTSEAVGLGVALLLPRNRASSSSEASNSGSVTVDTNPTLDFADFLDEDGGHQSDDSGLSVSGDVADADVLADQLEASLEEMIQTAQLNPRSFQVRMPLLRTMSMEQRWQDLANLLSIPGPDGAASAAGHAHLPHHAHHLGHASHPHFAHSYVPHHSHHAPLHNNSSHPHAAAAAVAAHAHLASHSLSHHHHHYGPAAAHHAYAGGIYPTDTTSNHRSVLLQNATLGPPLGDLGTNGSYPSSSLGSSVSLGSAVTTSMNLTNSTENGDVHSTNTYKVEGNSDMLYYPNANAEVNQTSDGFLSSILNDEDLQLMDMAMNDSMYSMRMMDHTGQNNTHAGHPVHTASHGHPGHAHNGSQSHSVSEEATSDSGHPHTPVSSTLSDNDWVTLDNSTSDTNGTDQGYMEGYATGGKYRPYDYYARQGAGVVNPDGNHGRVAQKKHQMFGKRTFQEPGTPGDAHGPITPLSLPIPTAHVSNAPPNKYDYSQGAQGYDGSQGTTSLHPPMEMKYGCGMDFSHHPHEVRGTMDSLHHNHTYSMPPEAAASHRPLARDKARNSNASMRAANAAAAAVQAAAAAAAADAEAASRDEKRALAMNIPISVDDVINLPMDEFNERLSKYELSEAQLSLIRDIRRRGKNKVAAQNCRKRKLDQILSLADEVKRVRERKQRLLREQEFLMNEKARVKDKFAKLYTHVFQALRDPEGRPYSAYEYSLQLSADGNILVVPRNSNVSQISSHQNTSATSGRMENEAGPSDISQGVRRKVPEHKDL